MRTILLIILVLLLIGAFPAWPYSSGWGYYPSGGIGLILLIVRIISGLVPIDKRIMRKGVHRDAIFAPTCLKMSMRENELAGIVVIAEVARKRGPAHSDLDVLADFEMKMRVVKTVRRAHRPDLLAPRYPLAAMHKDPIEMAVKGVDIFNAAAFTISMSHDHDVSPAHVTIAREHNDTIGNTIDRIAQVGVAAAASVPILPRMSMRLEAARF